LRPKTRARIIINNSNPPNTQYIVVLELGVAGVEELPVVVVCFVDVVSVLPPIVSTMFEKFMFFVYTVSTIIVS